MKEKYYAFREIKSLEELKSLLTLRYEVYHETDLRYFIEENDYGIDLDCYDFRSRHFGLFENNQKPIGYMRVVENAPSPQSEILLELLKKYPLLAEKRNANPEVPFPSMTYWSEDIKQVYKKIKKNNRDLVEGSRYVLKQDIRSFCLAKLILESAFAIYLFYYSNYAIMSCSLTHQRFYSRYGFAAIKEGKIKRYFGQIKGCCLLGSASSMPDFLSKRILQMAKVYEKTKQICYNPSNPEMFYEPMRSQPCESNIYGLAA